MKAFCHSFWLLLLSCQDDVGYMIDAKLDSKQEIDSVKTYKKVQKTDVGTKKLTEGLVKVSSCHCKVDRRTRIDGRQFGGGECKS